MALPAPPDDFTALRVAENQATFREANESIGQTAAELGVSRPIPFVCECAEEACRQIVLLPLDEYREVREHPRRFVNAPGHEVVSGPHGRVVEERLGYVIVEKEGLAGEVAEAEAKRDDGGQRS